MAHFGFLNIDSLVKQPLLLNVTKPLQGHLTDCSSNPFIVSIVNRLDQTFGNNAEFIGMDLGFNSIVEDNRFLERYNYSCSN